jgi:muramidase (phage lysozyme)
LIRYHHQAATAAAVAGLAALAWWWFDQLNQADQADQAEAAAPETFFDPWASWVETPLSDIQMTLTQDQIAAGNEKAFLMTIRHAEGTAGANGYRTLFGGSLFNSFADHPRIAKQFKSTDKKTGKVSWLWTSAAGAYQAMAVSPTTGGGSTKVDTWDRIKKKLGLTDFSPASQDAFAMELIREAGALADVRAGRFAAAVDKCRGTWASLPGAGYNQPEKSLPELLAVFRSAGGVVA